MSSAKRSPARKSPINSIGKVLLCLTAILLAVSACSGLPVYSHYEHIDSDGWLRDDSVIFTTSVQDSATYHLQLGLRATNAYPYTQITLTAHCHSAVSGIDFVDTITLNITDKEGDILGQGTSIFQYDYTLPDLSLHTQDTLTVSVAHAMSSRILHGITDVGLTIQ